MTQQKLAQLEAAWRYQNTVVEALEAERAPDKYIVKAKKERLRIKDTIVRLKGNTKDDDSKQTKT